MYTSKAEARDYKVQGKMSNIWRDDDDKIKEIKY